MTRHEHFTSQTDPLTGVHTHTAGQGPKILFVHGWRLDSTTEMVDYETHDLDLSAWQRIYLDLPGMGRSAVNPTLYDLGDYAYWLNHAIQALAQGEPIALAGSSTGAALLLRALELGDIDPLGILLRAPRVTAEPEHRAVTHAPLTMRAEQERKSKVEAVWQPAATRRHPWVQEIRDSPDRYALPAPSLKLDAPALILTGRQDSRVGYAEALQLVEHFPRCTYGVLDESEHEFPYQTGRPLFTALVSDWLRRAHRQSPRLPTPKPS